MNASITSMSIQMKYQNPFLRKPLTQYKAVKIFPTTCANYPFLHKEYE